MEEEELERILKSHKDWLNGDGGERADLKGANLSSANLKGADLKGVNLRNADFWDANLSGANLRNADFWDANLSGANLRGANLRNANLYNANLKGANLSGANLSGANLSGANLWDANLYNANLYNANLYNANLRNANLRATIGNMREIKSMQIDTYSIAYTDTVMQIGCKRHDIKDWFAFDDEKISRMDGKKALTFWRKWKPILQQIIGDEQ